MPPASLLERFAGVSVADVADLVGPLYVMSVGIRPLYRPMRSIAGWALTAKAWPADNLAVHGALALAREGAVLVVDWRGNLAGCGSGAQALVEPFRRGLRGVVVDGAWRDVEELRAHDFPVFGQGVSPFSPAKARPGEINVTVSCGGVVVEPGDVVVASDDGVAVVPQRYAQSVAAALGKALRAASTSDEYGRRAAGREAFFRWAFAAAGGVDESEAGC